MKLLKYLFGLEAEVTRKGYLIAGFALAALKFALDFAVVYFTTGKLWTILAYLSPALVIRNEAVGGDAPSMLLWGMAAYALPFAWVGLSMSVRRAANAGLSPWVGILFVVPIINWVMIIALSLFPTRAQWVHAQQERAKESIDIKSALLAIGLGTALTMSMVATGVFLLKEYGWSLFIGTPLVVGILAGYLTNKDAPRGWMATIATAAMSIVISSLATMLFAIEGFICLLMAALPAIVVATAGAVIGKVIAEMTVDRGKEVRNIALIALCLPFLAGAESLDDRQPLYEVVTTVEIDAPPMEVWHHVIHFSELDEPPAWVKRTGIAYPIRAKLHGRGVGAVRHCEFSTGAFIEPITRWEPGKRLSFDVAEQPIPMKEWSPYNNIHPPHLDGYLRSKRGEFRFIALPDGRTRLEGSTWYEIDISPRGYWSMMSDTLIHNIHERVLHHVRDEAEAAHKNKKTAAAPSKPDEQASR